MARTISDDQILDAALDVMARYGYDSATTRQIAAAAGVNEVTLFRRFGSKQKLLQAVVEQEAEHFLAADMEYTGSLEADLVRVVEFYHGIVHRRGQLIIMLLTELPRQPELRDILQVPLMLIGKITAMIARYQHEGKLVIQPPVRAVMALIGPLFMERMLRSVQSDIVTEPYDAAEQVQYYLQGHAVD